MLSKRAPLTRKEKSFFGLTIVLCVGVAVFGYLSATPEVKVAAPAPLPLQNAHSILATVQTATVAARAAVDTSVDLYYRTEEEKAWLYSTSRRKAWLKANAAIGVSIQKALKTPYRYPITEWSNYWNPKPSFSSSFISPYKMVEARTLISENRSGQALNSALDLVEIAGKVTHGAIDIGRDQEKTLIENASEIVREALASSSEQDLFQATQRMQLLLDDRESYDQLLTDWRNKDLSLLWGVMTGSPKVVSPQSSLQLDYMWRHFYSYDDEKTPEYNFYLFSKTRFIRDVEESFKTAKADAQQPFSKSSRVSEAFYLKDLISNLRSSRTEEAHILLQRRFLLLALALQTFKARYGHFPSNLSELSPKILKSLPIDPYSTTRNIFVYKSDGTYYLLYSVGYNAHDDSSSLPVDYLQKQSSPSPAPDDRDDIIFIRKPKEENLIPTGTTPKKPFGIAPLYKPLGG